MKFAVSPWLCDSRREEMKFAVSSGSVNRGGEEKRFALFSGSVRGFFIASHKVYRVKRIRRFT